MKFIGYLTLILSIFSCISDAETISFGKTIWSQPAALTNIDPVIIGDKIIYISPNNKISAISIQTGTILWESQYSSTSQFHFNPTLLITSLDKCGNNRCEQHLIGIDTNSGNKVYDFNFNDEVRVQLVIGDKVYVHVPYKMSLYKFDTKHKQIDWQSRLRCPYHLAVNNKTLFLSECEDSLAIDDMTGSTLWNHFWAPGTLVGKQYVYATFTEGRYSEQDKKYMTYKVIIALDKLSGSISWKKDVLKVSDNIGSTNSIFITDNLLIFTTHQLYPKIDNGMMMAIDAVNGNIIWQAPYSALSETYIYNDQIYFKVRDAIYCLDKHNGELVASYPFPPSAFHYSKPIVVNNILYTLFKDPASPELRLTAIKVNS